MLSLRSLFGKRERGALFHVMVNRMGLREAILSRPNSGPVMQRAQERCAGCGKEGACVSWLAENETPEEAPGFCRNHDMFERLKHEIEADAALQAA